MQKLGNTLKIIDKNTPKFFKFSLVLKIKTADPHKEPKNRFINNIVIWAEPSVFKK